MELSVADLVVRLGARLAVDRVSARFVPGRVTAVLGPNGSGKTTLLRALAGLLAPESGEASLDAQPVQAFDARERARLIGYLPQGGAVHWRITAAELVALGRLPHRAPFAGASVHDLEAVMAALAAADTVSFADRPVDTLSGGERARVLLARVLAGEPRWLLADEPLASLDPAHQLDLLDRLREAAGQGMGVVIVLHDLAHAARVADDVLLLREGGLVASGPTDAVLVPDRLREAFGVEVELVDLPGGRRVPMLVGRTPQT